MTASLVPAGISNRYQWKPKTPVEKHGVLSRGQWSRLRGTDWETGAFGLSQPVPKARFLVVQEPPSKQSQSVQCFYSKVHGRLLNLPDCVT